MTVRIASMEPRELAPEAAFRLALCTDTGEEEGRPAVRVEFGRDDGPPEWVPCLGGASIRPGDQVLLAPVKGGPNWVAVGALATGSEPAQVVRTRLPVSGYQLESEPVAGEDHVRLRDAAGALHLEMRFAEGRVLLRFPTRDAVLECDGNLEVRAGESLRLTAQDYELNVSGGARTTAAGKVQVEAAEQELRSLTGPMRLKAEKNMVIRGQFILLNSTEGKWT